MQIKVGHQLSPSLSVRACVCACTCEQQLDPPQQEQLNAALGSVAQQLRRLTDVSWLCGVIEPSDHEVKCSVLTE